jgi:hypothetical protein
LFLSAKKLFVGDVFWGIAIDYEAIIIKFVVFVVRNRDYKSISLTTGCQRVNKIKTSWSFKW